MKRRRIGNDISIEWRITRNGEPESFDGKDLFVCLLDPQNEVVSCPFTIDGNIVKVIFLGANQKKAGIYTILLSENKGKDGMTTVDCTKAIQLVNHTEEEGGTDCGNITTDTVELESEILTPRSGLSAYDIAVAHGFVGTEEEWLASLVGDSLYQLMVKNHLFDGTELEFLQEYINTLEDCRNASAEARAKVAEMSSKLAEINEKLYQFAQAEADRNVAERSRVSAEDARVQAEQRRVLAEQQRVTNESNRNAQENNRLSGERDRQNAESNRVASETSRRNAELTRELNEKNRVAAEAQRAKEVAEWIAEMKRLAENRFKVVDSLPAEGDPQYIYLVPSSDPKQDDIYEEWAFINGKWERLASMRVNLDDYYTIEEIEKKVATVQETDIVGDTITNDAPVVRVNNKFGRYIGTVIPAHGTYDGWLYEYKGGWRIGKLPKLTRYSDMTWGELLNTLADDSLSVMEVEAIKKKTDHLTRDGFVKGGTFYFDSIGTASSSIYAAIRWLLGVNTQEARAMVDNAPFSATIVADVENEENMSWREVKSQCVWHVEPSLISDVDFHAPNLLEKDDLHFATAEDIDEIFGVFPDFNDDFNDDFGTEI